MDNPERVAHLAYSAAEDGRLAKETLAGRATNPTECDPSSRLTTIYNVHKAHKYINFLKDTYIHMRIQQ